MLFYSSSREPSTITLLAGSLLHIFFSLPNTIKKGIEQLALFYFFEAPFKLFFISIFYMVTNLQPIQKRDSKIKRRKKIILQMSSGNQSDDNLSFQKSHTTNISHPVLRMRKYSFDTQKSTIRILLLKHSNIYLMYWFSLTAYYIFM